MSFDVLLDDDIYINQTDTRQDFYLNSEDTMIMRNGDVLDKNNDLILNNGIIIKNNDDVILVDCRILKPNGDIIDLLTEKKIIMPFHEKIDLYQKVKMYRKMRFGYMRQKHHYNEKMFNLKSNKNKRKTRRRFKNYLLENLKK